MAEPRHDDAPTVPVARVPDPGTANLRHVRLFGSRAFFRLWLAQVVSSMGDWLGFVAIVAVAARVSDSPESAIGVVMVARILPGFFLAPVAGVLVDRWDRKRVMVTCDIGRGLVLATVPFIDTVWGLFLASLLLEVPTLMWSPAKEASVPNLVPPDHLTTANSLSLAAAYGTFPIATALFAFFAKVAQWLGGYDALDFLRLNQESIALYFDVLTFFLSATIILTLPLPRRTPEVDHAAVAVDPRPALSRTFEELKEGWRLIITNPVVRAVLVAVTTGLIGGGMIVPLGPVFTDQVLDAGAPGFGLLLTALGIGVAVGVVGLAPILRRIPKEWAFTLAVFGAGGSLAAAALMGELGLAFTFVVVLGTCAGAVYVLGFTILQETVDDELRGRVFSALYTMSRFALLLSFGVAGFLSELLDQLSDDLVDRTIGIGDAELSVPGVRLSLLLSAGVIVAAGFLAAASLRRGRETADPVKA